MNTRMGNRNNPVDNTDAALTEFSALIEQLKKAYPAVQPLPQFRTTLYQRLLAEAKRLAAMPPAAPHLGLARRAVVGAVALSMAGLALAVWRSRIVSPTPTVPQLQTAQGS